MAIMYTREDRTRILNRINSLDLVDIDNASDIYRVLHGSRCPFTYDRDTFCDIVKSIRSLCESADDELYTSTKPLSKTDEEQCLAALISANVKRAVLEGDPETAIDNIEEAVQEKLEYERKESYEDGLADHSGRVLCDEDGVPIYTGDCVYDHNGTPWYVIGLYHGIRPVVARVISTNGANKGHVARLEASQLTHNNATGLRYLSKRISDLSEDLASTSSDSDIKTARELADHLLVLANQEG